MLSSLNRATHLDMADQSNDDKELETISAAVQSFLEDGKNVFLVIFYK